MLRIQRVFNTAAVLLFVIICSAHFAYEIAYPTHIRDFRFDPAEESARMQHRQKARQTTDLRSNKTWLYIITPTDASPLTTPELMRFSQTLSLVPRIHWILYIPGVIPVSRETRGIQVIRSSQPRTNELPETFFDMLEYSALPYTIIKASPDPARLKTEVECYSKALEFLKRSHAGAGGAVAFFGRSSTVDFRLLDQIRETEMVSSWPLALLDPHNTIIDPGDWANFSQADVSGECSMAPTIDLEALAVSMQHLRETGATLNPSSPCPAAKFLSDLTHPRHLHQLQIFRPPGLQKKAYAWKTRPRPLKKSSAFKIGSAKYKGTNLEKLQSQVIASLQKN